MICVYSRDCTDFTTNGLGSVTPISATVTETLNGEYELQLEHPIDAAGKWRRLTEGRILRVPVPAGFTPAVQVREQTSQTETDIYAVIDAVTSSLYLWGSCPTEYPVRYGKAIWSYRARTEVAVLSKADAPWFEVIGPDGKHGWMYGPYMRYVRTETSGEEAEAEIKDGQALREQPFRVYRVVPELDKITVYARHVFYDLLDNMIQSYAPSASDTGADAARGLSQACLSAHDFAFYSDLTSTAEDVSYVNVNPVEAIMGSDGLLTKYGGELTRDWWDVYLVGRVGTDSSVTIRQAKNLLGIKYDVDLTDVVTRIMPTGSDKNGEPLYLPELYVDSPQISHYAHPKWSHLDVSEAKEGKSDSGTKTKADCYALMRDAAQAQFDSGCDLPGVTLDVDFLNCPDTEEYKEYGFLQSIYLGDTVRVIVPRIGVSVAMRMTQYSYDCLQKKYTSMTLGDVKATLDTMRVSGGQISAGSAAAIRMGAGSVDSVNLKDGAVTAEKISSVNAETITEGILDGERLPFILAYGTTTVSGESWKSVSLADYGFDAAPAVIVSYGGGASETGIAPLVTRSESATGFQVRMAASGGDTTTRTVHWIAIGARPVPATT